MRCAVLADIHGNLPALEAVVADMHGRHVSDVVNLGDCVSGPLWPRETLDLLRSAGWPTVRGNHDRQVGGDGPAQMGLSDRYAAEALDASGRAWLATLPITAMCGDETLAMHARPDRDDAYLLEDQWGDRLVRAAPATIQARLGPRDEMLILTAHSHVPGSLRLPDGPWVVNPGSVGCPAYDDDSTDPPHISEQGSPAARYAIVETRAEGLMVELLSVSYDHERAATRAGANGRPEWAHALRTGFARLQGATR